MIFYGRCKNEAGIFRPYISAEILSPSNEWMEIDLLVNTGADETFLDKKYIDNYKRLENRNGVEQLWKYIKESLNMAE